MPELPEMENYRLVLCRQLKGRPITEVDINREKSINKKTEIFEAHLQGAVITDIRRRAKHLIFQLNTGNALLLHLMLGGWMYIGNDEDNPDRTKQVILSFGERKLYFIGLRLGFLHLLNGKELKEKLEELGPEPFDPSFTLETFQKRFGTKRGTLKSILIDQKFMAGIGNCYSDEICWQARLQPARKANELKPDEVITLYHAIIPVLENGIKFGGYIVNPIYAGDAKTGGYNNHLLVYDREDQPCLRCGTEIRKIEISSRKSFSCPNCQV
ncbi:bifunctional DNA-formamidopyrimidine glycosylase/DNA-(apurinic or apyrimidinic site) lyase [Fictibacillus terranigra]|uniref:Formamidopyrimidine-DNA glycosylase n=1 Tax=Fictibacillus terranigra TaxID=3058424 RepID=A0ABT8E9B5_9BACL|nr:bifunctional DNA-formamidopyrimidine glycosylase/DNA-(apurinic or apyrimidinic site) lyase [Fictibacillus sp. CENA-BCM004]MDN4074503.1 bifunctional DNA-formamidopyrimidine glycosylase/DNA-(apurinic or apyrimidinic site) lyase [Fictibacillus sp. CENA-BCM004]